MTRPEANPSPDTRDESVRYEPPWALGAKMDLHMILTGPSRQGHRVRFDDHERTSPRPLRLSRRADEGSDVKPFWLLAAALGLLGSTASCGDEQQEAAFGQRALGATSADGGVGNVALAGNVVLLVQEGEHTLRVRRVPLDGTQSTTALTVRLSPDKIPSGQLAGSDALAGLILHTETPTSTLGHSQIFRGAPLGRLVALGPLKPVRPTGYFAAAAQADEKRLFVTEARSDLRAARHVVYEISRRPRPIDLPAKVLQTDFAGDLVAYVAPTAKPRRLVVRNWRTGARSRRGEQRRWLRRRERAGQHRAPSLGQGCAGCAAQAAGATRGCWSGGPRDLQRRRWT